MKQIQKRCDIEEMYRNYARIKPNRIKIEYRPLVGTRLKENKDSATVKKV